MLVERLHSTNTSGAKARVPIGSDAALKRRTSTKTFFTARLKAAPFENIMRPVLAAVAAPFVLALDGSLNCCLANVHRVGVYAGMRFR